MGKLDEWCNTLLVLGIQILVKYCVEGTFNIFPLTNRSQAPNLRGANDMKLLIMKFVWLMQWFQYQHIINRVNSLGQIYKQRCHPSQAWIQAVIQWKIQPSYPLSAVSQLASPLADVKMMIIHVDTAWRFIAEHNRETPISNPSHRAYRCGPFLAKVWLCWLWQVICQSDMGQVWQWWLCS